MCSIGLSGDEEGGTEVPKDPRESLRRGGAAARMRQERGSRVDSAPRGGFESDSRELSPGKSIGDEGLGVMARILLKKCPICPEDREDGDDSKRDVRKDVHDNISPLSCLGRLNPKHKG